LINGLKYAIPCYFFILLIWKSLPGQITSDTIHLPELEVKASYAIDDHGFKLNRIDSAYLTPLENTDLSTVLSQHSTIFIKSYGNGNLATPSFRGTSAHHTQVEWNGITLNSPMLGQIDLSQIPVSQFNELEILYGAAGLSRSNGAFGGIVNLITNPDWENRLSLSVDQSIACFDNYVTNIGIEAGNTWMQSNTHFNYACALNDFPFINDTGATVRQQNASYSLAGISEQFFFRIKERHLLTARIWYSYSDRNVPPTVSNYDPQHVEKIKEESLRAIAEYKFVRPSWNFLIRSALIDQYMDYTNDSLRSRHQYYSSVNNTRFSYTKFSFLIFRSGIDFTYDCVSSDEYDGLKTRTTLGFYGDILVKPYKKVDISLIIRQDMIDGKTTPFIAALGAEYRPFRNINLAISANLSRNYRYPTLNDLYWNIMGNPDLDPETNYMAETSITMNWTSQKKKFFIEGEITGYYSKIFDLIQWLPDSVTSIFRPVNVNEVFARGIEVGIRMKGQVARLTLGWENNYQYCLSTYEKAKSVNDQSVGKQMIYTPIHTFNSTFTADVWNIIFSYNITFTGIRYTGTDNLTYMPAYSLSNIFLTKKFCLNKIVLSLQGQINNLFNLDYQSIKDIPMPGINYGITIKIDFRE
jgi:iron complex outermembrane receptor protein